MGRVVRPTVFLADKKSAVAVIAVMVIGVVFAMAALSIDASRFYLVKRQLQMVTDLAAVAAAANLDNPRAAVLANLAANGLPASDLVLVELGTYTANTSVSVLQRFVVASGTSTNAVRVTLQTHPSSFFAGALGPIAAVVPTLTTQSVAANGNTADFSLGSTLATFDGGLANAILGGLTGSQVSLSALDYQNLVSARIDLFGLANALAVRIGAGSVTLSALAAMPIHLSDLVSAAADAGSAAGMPFATVAALRSIAASVISSGSSITLGALVNYSVYGDALVSAPPPVTAALTVLSLVTAAARLSAGTGEIQANLGATIPGILGATVKMVSGAVPTGGTYAGVGPTGTTLHTAQTRVLLTLQLAGLGTITALNLPLYVEVAPATGRIASIACASGTAVDPPVTLGVTPGVVTGWIGSVSDASLTDMTSEPSPGPAVLTNLLLIAVSGRAEATISNTSESLVPFSIADIAAGLGKTVSTTDYTSSLLGQLFGSLQLSASILGINTAVPLGTSASIGQLLQTRLQPIDTELSNTLAMLGLTIGNATSLVGGVRCGGGALVN